MLETLALYPNKVELFVRSELTTSDKKIIFFGKLTSKNL